MIARVDGCVLRHGTLKRHAKERGIKPPWGVLTPGEEYYRHNTEDCREDFEKKENRMTAPSTSTGVTLTEAAAAKAKALMDQEGRDDLSLRIAVQPGGCAGLRYQLMFDDRELDGDIAEMVGGVRFVVDKMSAPYLTGATIDFADTIESQGFTIDNPNATGSCACGDSFN